MAVTVLADVCMRATFVNTLRVEHFSESLRTANVVAWARVRVTVGRTKVELPAVTLVGDEVWIAVRRLALDHRL